MPVLYFFECENNSLPKGKDENNCRNYKEKLQILTDFKHSDFVFVSDARYIALTTIFSSVLCLSSGILK